MHAPHEKQLEAPNLSPQQDSEFHTYVTHRIPWYVRVMWIVFWIGLIWYVIKFAIPSARSFL
jgi:hypothetical protein